MKICKSPSSQILMRIEWKTIQLLLGPISHWMVFALNDNPNFSVLISKLINIGLVDLGHLLNNF